MEFLAWIFMYARAAWENLFTRFGYSILFLGFLLDAFTPPSWHFNIIALGIGGFLLVGSRFAVTTFVVYRRVIAMYLMHERPSARFLTIAAEGGYCATTGLKLALKDIKYMNRRTTGSDE